MAPVAESTTCSNAKGYTKNDAINALRKELEKGIKSIKNGDVYSIEEAWDEIDKI
ncbi:MAG: hypothetical protein PHV18_10000 [Lachnospiraceae bacterium]|nr:hypothetical protein [Lachnospiraceae bacterium]